QEAADGAHPEGRPDGQGEAGAGARGAPDAAGQWRAHQVRDHHQGEGVPGGAAPGRWAPGDHQEVPVLGGGQRRPALLALPGRVLARRAGHVPVHAHQGLHRAEDGKPAEPERLRRPRSGGEVAARRAPPRLLGPEWANRARFVARDSTRMPGPPVRCLPAPPPLPSTSWEATTARPRWSGAPPRPRLRRPTSTRSWSGTASRSTRFSPRPATTASASAVTTPRTSSGCTNSRTRRSGAPRTPPSSSPPGWWPRARRTRWGAPGPPGAGGGARPRTAEH